MWAEPVVGGFLLKRGAAPVDSALSLAIGTVRHLDTLRHRGDRAGIRMLPLEAAPGAFAQPSPGMVTLGAGDDREGEGCLKLSAEPLYPRDTSQDLCTVLAVKRAVGEMGFHSFTTISPLLDSSSP